MIALSAEATHLIAEHGLNRMHFVALCLPEPELNEGRLRSSVRRIDPLHRDGEVYEGSRRTSLLEAS